MKVEKRPLRIAIDAVQLNRGNITGIGNVIVNYLVELQKIDTTNEYIICPCGVLKHVEINNPKWQVYSSGIARFFNKIQLSCEKKNSTFSSKLQKIARLISYLTDGLLLPFILRYKKIDVYIGTSPFYYPLFFLPGIKKISFVYDIVWKLYPETMSAKNRAIMKLTTLRNMKRSDLLVAISENTKKDIRDNLGVTTPVVPILLASDKEIFYKAKKADSEKIKKKYNITKKYLLTVSTLEPRKNMISILRAFSRLENYKDYQLVLVGRLGWIGKEFFSDIGVMGIEDSLLITGYIPGEDLAPLYTGAEAFVFPSLYEGFGLPVLEAMQCGCPVITAHNSSLPEVIGDAGILVDARNIDDITAALKKVLTSSGLINTMRKKGLKQAEKFSWKKSAQELLQHINSEGEKK
ncbi:MAG: glycosyltransferase family 4 protein [bacterium]|nr:glycosyltransferase family 4 protein [bacterium]